MPFADIRAADDWPAYGVPAGCRLLVFTDPDEATHDQYAAQTAGDTTGYAVAIRDPAGGLRTLIQIPAGPAPGQFRGQFELMRLGVLLHEVGHVRDHEAGRHFGHDTGTVDWVAAEVSANLFALVECDRRGYLATAACFRESLRPWLAEAGLRRAVAGQVLAAPVPETRPWQTYLRTRRDE